jgi:iron complex outermembrane receptor protein
MKQLPRVAFWAFFLFAFTSKVAFSQQKANLQLINKNTREPIPGCVVQLSDGTTFISQENGLVKIETNGNLKIRAEIKMLGFFPFTGVIALNPDETKIIELVEKTVLGTEVIILGTLPVKDQPTTYAVIDSKEINRQNLGQDLPYLLQTATSVVSTSDAGTGIGYTGLSVRGSDATRVNITMNGIPINDSESHGVFWVNMPDLASSVDQIQIQRGVGSSTNGSAAFGASINLQTNNLKNEAYGLVNVGAGSFNTQKANISAGTGLLNNGFTFDVRLSKIKSDGFIDRATSNLESAFLSFGYYSPKRITKFNFIGGRETTYQAWNGVPEARLRGNSDDLLNYIQRNGLGSKDSLHLFSSNARTYNPFTYANQTDNYQQNHYQLFHSEKVGKSGMFHLAFHLTDGSGYYEELKENELISLYGLQPLVIGADTIQTMDLVRQRWLDNLFGGSVYSYTQTLSEKTSLTTGGGINQYDGAHFGNVIKTEFSDNNFEISEYYRNRALKKDFHHYLKITHYFSAKIMLYTDVQVRFIDYRFDGFNTDFSVSRQRVNYLFFNPKIGATYFLNDHQNLYLSYAKSGREPVRDDFINSTSQSRPMPEVLHNTESGWRFIGKRIKAGINHYFMYYENQLVLTGKINDVGAFTRTNVPKSFRTGLEGECSLVFNDQISVLGNVSYSLNRVIDYQQYYFNYDTGTEEVYSFSSAPIAFSPDLIAAFEINFKPLKGGELGLIGKHVGRQYLDNTGDLGKSVRDYTLFHLRGSYSFEGERLKGFTLRLLVNNLFSKVYETHGYTFGYLSGGRQITENFYFPQAGLNFLGSVQFNF